MTAITAKNPQYRTVADEANWEEHDPSIPAAPGLPDAMQPDAWAPTREAGGATIWFRTLMAVGMLLLALLALLWIVPVPTHPTFR